MVLRGMGNDCLPRPEALDSPLQNEVEISLEGKHGGKGIVMPHTYLRKE